MVLSILALASNAAEQNYAQQVDAELAARNIPVPPEMNLDIEWYTPHVDAGKAGRIIKGWVKEDLVLLETDKNHLIAVNREDGVERWDCELQDVIRYAPAVSRNNVVVNVNNYLVAIEKNRGDVRWRLLPDFVMSCAPLVIDPPIYPREYTKTWMPLESIYVGSWDGRFQYVQVRGRMTYYGRNSDSQGFAAPDFDLSYPWHKTHRERGVITAPIKLRENTFYYAADDQNCYAVTREGEEREPYYMQGVPVTGVTVMAPSSANSTNSAANSFYVGGEDNYVYCLDRLTLKKKWAFAPGYRAIGDIMADDPTTPMVYAATVNGLLHAIQITPAHTIKGQPEVPETINEAWQLKDAVGVVTAGPDIVYAGYRRTAKKETSKNAKDAIKTPARTTNPDIDYPSFTGIAAVEKSSGKVLWKSEDSFFTSYLEFHNAWSQPRQAAHVYAITSDNRLVSLKEKLRDTGIRVIKPIIVEPEMPKMPTPHKKGDAAPAADAPKADAPKADAPKADAPKADAPKADAPKVEEKK